ncbi:MAG: hypothetical protein QXY39_03730 [Thermofilaceae archaeon]
MSFPNWQLFLGSRAILIYNYRQDSGVFGHGQRLRDLTVTRNYGTIYTIGSRELTAMPAGQFRVSWGIDAVLSNLNILCLLFECSNQQNGFTGSTLREPIYFDIQGYLASGQTIKKLNMTNAVLMETNISAEAGRPEVSLSLTGVARDIGVSDETSVPAVSFPQRLFTFAGARLLAIDNSEIYSTRAEISIRQGGEPVYRIGDDKFGAVYLGEYEVSLTAEIPLSNISINYLNKLLNNECINGIKFELKSCNDPICSNQGQATITFTTEGVGKIVDYRMPITDIGLNTTTLEMRFSRVLMEVVYQQ